MSDDMEVLFEGEIEGRAVTLEKYIEGWYKVKTTQKTTETSTGLVDENSYVGGFVISEGDNIDIEAESIDELYSNLLEFEFTEEAAKFIVSKAI